MQREPQAAPQTTETMRRRLRSVLRQSREARQMTQREVATTLEWSLSKIIRIEAGAVGVTTTDLKALLELYQIDREDERLALLELARLSKKRSWGEYKAVYSEAALNLFGSEGAAKVILKYEPTFIPGLFQTEEYARALLRGVGVSDENTIELRVAARLDRQDLLEQDVRPDLYFIIGEAVVSRAVGGRGVMRQQLDHLKFLNEQTKTNIYLLPFAAGATPKMGGAFTVLQFEDENLDDVLYLENAGGQTLTRDNVEAVADYTAAFEIIRDLCYPPEEFSTRVEEIEITRFSS